MGKRRAGSSRGECPSKDGDNFFSQVRFLLSCGRSGPFSLPLFVFGRVLLSRDSSSLGGFSNSNGGANESIRESVHELGFLEEFCVGCENLRSVEVRGYASWEESCLVKFSEFLGFSTVGNKEEFINMLRKLNDKKQTRAEVVSIWVL